MRISRLYYNFLVTIKERISRLLLITIIRSQSLFLSSKGKRSGHYIALPYGIYFETANRLIEIEYWRSHLIENENLLVTSDIGAPGSINQDVRMLIVAVAEL